MPIPLASTIRLLSSDQATVRNPHGEDSAHSPAVRHSHGTFFDSHLSHADRADLARRFPADIMAIARARERTAPCHAQGSTASIAGGFRVTHGSPVTTLASRRCASVTDVLR